MKRNKTTYSIMISLLSLLFLAYSAVLQFSMPSIVLCFGEDGHVAFEKSDENCLRVDFEDSVVRPIFKNIDFFQQKVDCQDLSLPNVLSSIYLEKDGPVKTVKLTGVTKKMEAIKSSLISKLSINNNSAIIRFSMKSLQSTILLI